MAKRGTCFAPDGGLNIYQPIPEEPTMQEKIDAILKAADEVLEQTEGPTTPPEARLALALYDYDPARFGLGGKESCPCDDKENCDECMTTPEAMAACRRLAARDQQSST